MHFRTYDKTHNTSTLLYPLSRSEIPPTTKILLLRLTFEVHIIDIPHFCKMKTRLCADGSKIVESIDSENSYALTADIDSFRTIVTLVAQLNLLFYFFDTENDFQTNVIDDPTALKDISGFNYAGIIILFIEHMTTENSHVCKLFAICKVLKMLVTNSINFFLESS